MVLSWISPFRYSLGFLLFRYSPGSHLSGTRSDPTFPVLARISTFPTLTQILPFPNTCPDPSLVLARIPPFSGTRPDFHLSGTHLDSTFFGTRLDFYFSGTHPDSTISWYSPGLFFGTRPDSTFPTLTGILPFPILTWIQPFPVLARTLLRSLPGFPNLPSPPNFIIFYSIVPGSFIFLSIVPGFL